MLGPKVMTPMRLDAASPIPIGESRVLSPAEADRYARHLILADIGGPGQQKLKRSSLLVIGAGGLGGPLLAYAAAAGIGRIGIADGDAVAVSNLQRQILYATDDVGSAKAERAAAGLRRLNPHIAVEVHPRRIDAANADALVASYDIVADCSDNAETRYAVSDACFHKRRTLVTAAASQFDGTLTTLKPHERSPSGTPNPTYRCLFPQPATDGMVADCAVLGIFGPVTGILGSLQAGEVIKEIVGLGSTLVGRLLMVDGRDLRFTTIAYGWDPANPLNGAAAKP